jgi:hypothetical protein
MTAPRAFAVARPACRPAIRDRAAPLPKAVR